MIICVLDDLVGEVKADNGPSNFTDFAQFFVAKGIDSISAIFNFIIVMVNAIHEAKISASIHIDYANV